MAIPGNLLSPVTESVDPNTSGWTARQNCTLSLGTGGRNGPGCLAVQSAGAGEVQARTVTSYPIVPGTLYQVFADASGVTVPERIGIRWLDAAGTEISITWSLTTAAASATWHRVGAAGTAPLTAARAQVLLSSTPAAAGVIQFWENVYLGLPWRTTGNLFGFNTESSEVDASSWQTEVNAGIARQAPVMSWGVDVYTAGGSVIALTAAAAGDSSMVTTDRPTVTPGTDYLAYAYMQPPTASTVTWIELRFYDSGGVQLQASRAVLAAPGTGLYRQRVSSVAPSGAATCAVAAGITGATTGQVLRLETIVVTVAPPIMAGTVIPYAAGDFEQGLAGWSKTAGTATAARTSPWSTTMAYRGNYAMQVTAGSTSPSTIVSPTFPTPGAGGTTWRVNFFTRAVSGAWTFDLRVRWYDAGGVDLGSNVDPTWTTPDAQWYQLYADVAAPEEAAQARVELILTGSSAAAVLYIDLVSLWPALPLTEITPMSADGYVRIIEREMVVGRYVTVYRVTPDSQRTAVRGPSGLIVQQPITSDLLVIEDHEAPFGVPVYYIVITTDAAGTVYSTRISGTVQLTIADPNTAWLKDPGNPQRNMLVMVRAAPDWSAPIEQASYAVAGRSNKVIHSGVRNGLEGDLAVWTRSDAERKALRLLIGSGNLLLWQATPGMGVEDMYVNVGQTTEGRITPYAPEPWRAWTLPLVEADMPVTVGVNGAAGRTWQDILSEFATWQEVLDTYATWEDLLLDRRKGD